jgi:tripartite-type tricarboxylate transporter receptor subunit TctC
VRWIALLALAVGASHTAAQEQRAAADTDYPNRPVRVIVGLAPGGATDIIARMLAQRLSASFGRSFVVENRPGAGGTVAYPVVASSPADGYTLLAVASGFTISSALYPKLPYDPQRDFTPISLATRAPFVLAMHPSVPIRSVKELVAFARAKPGALDFASAGIASSTHMALELFRTTAAIKITHIPYKGTGQALGDLLAGQVHATFGNVVSTLPHVTAGRLRGLGITSAKRSPVAPLMPTIAEGGLAGFENSTWHAWFGPAGMPTSIVERLSSAIAKALAHPEVANRLRNEGAEGVGSTSAELKNYVVTELARWKTVVKVAGLKAVH